MGVTSHFGIVEPTFPEPKARSSLLALSLRSDYPLLAPRRSLSVDSHPQPHVRATISPLRQAHRYGIAALEHPGQSPKRFSLTGSYTDAR